MVWKSLSDCFADSFLTRAGKKAITFLRAGKLETEISYLELNLDSNRLANAFRELGVEKGDRVILFVQKSLISVIAHLALQKIGAIAVPLNPGFKKFELEYLLRDAQARLVLSEPENETLIKAIDPAVIPLTIDTHKPYQEVKFFQTTSATPPPIEINPDDAGLIVYTSGTTGKPKGAILTHSNLVHDARNIITTWEITASDVLCHALPLFHVHGLCFALHTTLMAGAHVIMLDQFCAQNVLDVLSQKQGPLTCTLFMAVPSMYGRLMDCPGANNRDFENIRLWASGSAPLLARDFERIKQTFGKEPVEREGMSETGMNFSNPIKGKRKPGSIGLPLPNLEVRIVNPASGIDVIAGQSGEIWLKGPAVTPGYWHKPAETAKAFNQGWFRTGDLGRIDKDGYYYLTDRIKHIIISGGENISPKEIESVINQAEGVVESSVVGIPDAKWGEKLVAAVVARSGADVRTDDIQKHCRQHLHNLKCPKEIVLVEELPRNTMGKVLKGEVKKLFIGDEKGDNSTRHGTNK